MIIQNYYCLTGYWLHEERSDCDHVLIASPTVPYIQFVVT